MNSKLKKTLLYTVSIILITGAALFISMEDYQKDRMSEFLGSLFSDSKSIKG